MKVLFVTTHITHPSFSFFMRNQTGFGYMVFDIAKHISRDNNVDLFVANTFSPSIQLEGVKIIKRTWLTYLCGLSLMSLLDGINFFRKYKVPFKRSLRGYYMYTSISQLLLNLTEYDVVHIHGCSEITDSTIRLCKKVNVPFIVTLHGLNSFEGAINLHNSLKQYERDFLQEADINNYSVSFISTGNKTTVEFFLGHEVPNFRVICNGCEVLPKAISEDIRKVYSISDDDFVFAFVGNVSTNKNQVQVVRAWQLLPENLRKKCKVLFVGRFKEDDEIVNIIRDGHLECNLILCGMQPKDRVASFYYACNATILTSITEGFGLSIIEGFVYGKPNVTFADLPAIPDIYDKNAMILAEGRSDNSLAISMQEMIYTSFDKSYISNYSKKFSFDRMSQLYVDFYNITINHYIPK